MQIYDTELKANEAYLLARVSTAEQKKQGNSIPAQVKRIENYINRNDKLTLVESFTFDESARKEDRKQFESFLKRVVKARKTIAICSDKVDRLLREFATWLPKLEKLRQKGLIELHFASDNLIIHQHSPATDLFRYNMAVILAQYYADSISDNTRRGLEGKVMRGEWPSGNIPLGYKPIRKIVGDKVKTINIVIDSNNSSIIQKLFKLYATGLYSLDQLRAWSFEHGFKSRYGKKPSRRLIADTLQNPFYFGMMRFKGKKFPHIYKPLIAKDLFDKVQGVFEERNNNKMKCEQKELKLFQGMMKCKKCGCAITAESKKNGRYILYSCTNYNKTCERIYVNEKIISDQLISFFKNIQLTDEQVTHVVDNLRNLHEAHKEFQHATIEKLQKEYRLIQQHMDSLFDKYTKPESVISDGMYKNKISDLTEQQRVISAKLNVHSNNNEQYHITALKIMSLSQKALSLFKGSNIEQKRQLINFALSNLELEGKKLYFTIRSPFDDIVKAVACNNLGQLCNTFRTINTINLANELEVYQFDLPTDLPK